MIIATPLVAFLCIPPAIANIYQLKRTEPPERTLEWAEQARDELLRKYDASVPGSPTKRQSTGSGQLTNYNRDVAYYIPAQFGTPPQTYNVLLDTGSSDMWLASSSCQTGCNNIINLYQAGQGSSTYNTTGSQPFAITYVGGSIQGTTAADTVALVGFSVPNQAFGVITTLQGTSIPPNVTGLMGMGFPRLAHSGTPWWIRSAQMTPWAQPFFAFSLLRQNSAPGSGQSTPGGTFSIGQLDNSAFQGNIEYTTIPAGLESWWLIPLIQIGVGGQYFTISNAGLPSLAAIDTATSIIGGPAAVVREVYAKIPGSQRGTGASAGYWFYPCSTNVTLSFNFGGRTWAMDPIDFALASTNPGTCTGALFEVTFSSATGPQWIIGDAFLKNVYSVFRYDPPSVGFANRAGSVVAAPSATGSAIISASATGTASGPLGSAFSLTNIPQTPTNGPSSSQPSQTSGAISTAKVAYTWNWLYGLVTMGLVYTL